MFGSKLSIFALALFAFSSLHAHGICSITGCESDTQVNSKETISKSCHGSNHEEENREHDTKGDCCCFNFLQKDSAHIPITLSFKKYSFIGKKHPKPHYKPFDLFRPPIA